MICDSGMPMRNNSILRGGIVGFLWVLVTLASVVCGLILIKLLYFILGANSLRPNDTVIFYHFNISIAVQRYLISSLLPTALVVLGSYCFRRQLKIQEVTYFRMARFFVTVTKVLIFASVISYYNFSTVAIVIATCLYLATIRIAKQCQPLTSNAS